MRKAEVLRVEPMNEALDYRRQGYTYRQISERLKCAPQTAHNYVRDGLAMIPVEAADDVRAMELDRLDFMQQQLFLGLRRDQGRRPD